MNTVKRFHILLVFLVISMLAGFGQEVYVGATEGVAAVSPSGGATYSIPIKARSGMSDFRPEISLFYNSQGGNGIAGYGWSISGLSAIAAVPHTVWHDGYAGGVRADESDAYSIDENRMFVRNGFQHGTVGSEYVTESETYSRIKVTRAAPEGTARRTPYTFVVQTPDGSTLTYGENTDAVNCIGRAACSWLISSAEDIDGNEVTYKYVKYGGISHISRISYGYNAHADNQSACTVDFVYEDRPDTIRTCVSDAVLCHTKRLKSIECRYYGELYRTYTLSYARSAGGFSHLVSVKETGTDGKGFAPTVFTWDDLPSFQIGFEEKNVAVAYDDKPDEMFMFGGDLDNDGRTELIGLSPIRERTGGTDYDYTGVSVYAYNGRNGMLLERTARYKASASIDAKKLKSLPGGGMVAHLSKGLSNSIVLPYYGSDYGGKYIYYEFPIEGLVASGKLGFTSELPCNHIADFNMDGIDEIVYIEKKALSDGIVRVGYMYMDVEERAFENEHVDLALSLTESQKADRIYNSLCSDFNGDGLPDIMLLLKKSSLILWNDNGRFTASNVSSYTDMANSDIARIGDFNGDGLLDLLFNSGPTCRWKIALNKGGKKFASVSIPYLQSRNAIKQGENDSVFSCVVHDFNGDGATDMVVGYVSGNAHKTVWLESDRDGTFTVRKEVTASNTGRSVKSMNMVQGDFDRNGVLDLLCYGGNMYTGVCPQEKPWILYAGAGLDVSSNRIVAVTDGLGKNISFGYGLLTDGYTYNEELRYPLAAINYPISVTKNITVSAGDTAYTTGYGYAGGVLHLQGKGFLGFAGQSATKDGITAKKTFGINEDYYVPYLSSECATDSLGEEISRNTYEYDFLPAENGAEHSFVCQLTRTTSADKVAMTSKTVTYSGYTYGRPASVRTEGETVCEQTFAYKNVTSGGKWVLGLPLTSQKTVRNYSEKTICVYDADNRLYRKAQYVSTESPASLNLTGTEIYAYDACGHVTSVKRTLYDASSDVLDTQYTYDDKGRVSRKISPEGLSRYYYYNTAGLVWHEADDFNCHKYTYFDGMGRMARTVMRLIAADNSYKDEETLYTYTAENKDGNAYKVTVTSPGSPTKTTRYDALGRTTMAGEVHFDGKEYVTENKYVTENLVGFVSVPHVYGSSVSAGTATSYDSFLRPLKVVGPDGRDTQYAYSESAEGQVVACTTNSRKVTETYDKDGRVVSRTDNGGTVRFAYTDFGGYSRVSLSARNGRGTAGITFAYDKYARKVSYTDPGGVTKRYTYDKWGNNDAVISASGLADKFVYNKYGELVERIYIPEDTTARRSLYTYDASHRLVCEQGGGYRYDYAYDDNGRISEEKYCVSVSTDTACVTRVYDYGEGGNIRSVSSRIDGLNHLVVERNEYTGGWLSAVSVNGKTVWKRTSEDSRGYVDGIEDVYGKQSLTFNDAGNVTSLSVEGYYGRFLETRTYSYNSRGKLSSDNGRKVSYDIMDRLTGWGDKSYKYDTWDNISKIGDQGSVVYDKMRLVGVTEPDPAVWGSDEQSVDYNPMSRPYKVQTDDRSSFFHYDAGGNRIATVRYKYIYIPPVVIRPASSEESPAQGVSSGIGQITGPSYPGMVTLDMNRAFESVRLYAGDSYEVYREKSRTRHHLCYIGGTSSTAPAVYVIHDGTATLYMLYRDRQGSIIAKVSDKDIERYDYDPWGCPTIDGEKCESGEAFKKVFVRGYLGQEHIGHSGLINLNARLYSPYAGRFLSPDPVTDFGGGFFGFNGYAYCHNNPFRYVDPNGENPWLIAGLAVAGAYLFGAVSNGGELNPLQWNYSAASTYLGIGLGALVGGACGYGIINPETVKLVFDVNTKWLSAGVSVGFAGMGTNWNFDFHWTTAAGGGGSIIGNISKEEETEADEINYEPFKMAGAASAAVFADDVTGLGVWDDVAIPVVYAGAAAYFIYDNYEVLTRKMEMEIDAIRAKQRTFPQGEVYLLIALKDGDYPNVRGGVTPLKAGETWKIGETTMGDKRYAKTKLEAWGVKKLPVYWGKQNGDSCNGKKTVVRVLFPTWSSSSRK
ncbi:MAG: FG-GAP-like repeat-containing protein [Bacteroides sp.]|nr:FG-GAP-like repeat-containing protein [Roseburia sp.]MCM1347595.1 FG-GAP-like repeat-containing protein [Bacteroides sp.]MCM1422090.1 FG-GAP-like repeat-containing protein [Bacteroides sp.]